MTPPDLDLQESSNSTILRDECSGRVHPKAARKPNNNHQEAFLGCAVSKWKTRSGVLEKLTRGQRWISNVQFWYAKKARRSTVARSLGLCRTLARRPAQAWKLELQEWIY